MSLESRGVLKRVVAVSCMMLLLEQTPLVTTAVAHTTETTATAGFSHSSPPYIQPLRRTIISTKISDPADIKLARCYFRTSDNTEYFYVTMKAGADGTFSATLPALGNIVKSLQYRMLAINNAEQVIKSAEFVVPVNREWGAIPSWQTGDYSKTIQLSTEAEHTAIVARGLLRVDDTFTIASTNLGERYLSNALNAPEQPAITAMAANPILVASPPSSSASQKEATPQSVASTIMGMKSSTFWWIVSGATAVVIGGTVAALNSGSSSGGGAKTGAVGVSWGSNNNSTGSAAIHW